MKVIVKLGHINGGSCLTWLGHLSSAKTWSCRTSVHVPITCTMPHLLHTSMNWTMCVIYPSLLPTTSHVHIAIVTVYILPSSLLYRHVYVYHASHVVFKVYVVYTWAYLYGDMVQIVLAEASCLSSFCATMSYVSTYFICISVYIFPCNPLCRHVSHASAQGCTVYTGAYLWYTLRSLLFAGTKFSVFCHFAHLKVLILAILRNRVVKRICAPILVQLYFSENLKFAKFAKIRTR